MSQIKLDRLISPLLVKLGQFGLVADTALEAVLQVLVWAKLTRSGRLPEALRLTPELATDARSAQAVLDQLDGLPYLRNVIQGGLFLQPRALLDAVEFASDAMGRGYLDDLDAEDIVTLIQIHGPDLGLPPEVCDLLATLVDPIPGDTSYCPWDWGGRLAVRLSRAGAQASVEIPRSSGMPGLIGELCGQEIELSHGDPIRNPSFLNKGRLARFNISVACPPFGMRYETDTSKLDVHGRFPEATSSVSVLAVRHLLAQTLRRVVIVVPNSLLFGAGAELALRKDLISRGAVEAVIAMPSGLLRSTNIGFSVVLLNPKGGCGKVRFVNADAPRFIDKGGATKNRLVDLQGLLELVADEGVSDWSVSVPVEALLENEAQLQVDRYVLSGEARKVRNALAHARMVPLGELVATVRPLSAVIKSAEVEDSLAAFEVSEIGVSDIPAYGYIRKPSRRLMISDEVVKRHRNVFLQTDDIVLIIKGGVGKVGIVHPRPPEPGPDAWVVGQSGIVLRGQHQSEIVPRVLAMLLRSPLGQTLLSGVTSGATIPLIQIKELMQLAVPIPSRELADAALQALESEDAAQQEIDALVARQAGFAHDLWRI